MTMKGERASSVIVLAAVVLVAAVAGAAIPEKINYQGRLTDSGTGLPLPGSHSAVFKIYDDPMNGGLLWSETTSVTADTNGVFAVILGDVNPIDIDFDGPTYLQVEIDGETLTPRRELVSSPYAFNAMNAENLNGLPAGDYPTSGELSASGILNDPSNPVDWTQLKNVPAGFADDTDDEGGSGDGHSLDAADGDPVDVVFVDNTGDVGVGTTTPDEKLHVSGDIRLDAGGDVAFGDDNNRLYHSADDMNLTADDDLMLKPDDDVYIGIDGSTNWAHFDAGHKRLGVGLTNPSNELHLHYNGGAPCYLELTNTSTGTTDDDGLIVGINGSGDAFIYNQEPGEAMSLGTDDTRRLYITPGGDVAIGGHTNPAELLDVGGNIQADELHLGDNSTHGFLEVGAAGVTGAIAAISMDGSHGGQFWMYDESGHATFGLQPDHGGEGGYLRVKRNTIDDGFRVDGHYGTSESARVLIDGESSQVDFRMDLTGDNSVQLPNGSVSALERGDEPGVASAIRNGPYYYLTSTLTPIESRSSVNPGADYCLVIATCEVWVDHVNGSSSSAYFGVSSSSSELPSNQDFSLIVPSSAEGGNYFFPVTVHSVLEAYQGSDVFYLLAREVSGDVAVYDIQLSIVYFPTAYGTVEIPAKAAPTDAEEQKGSRPPLTEADIETERLESEAFYRQRVEEEMADMRARLEALEQDAQEQQ